MPTLSYRPIGLIICLAAAAAGLVGDDRTIKFRGNANGSALVRTVGISVDGTRAYAGDASHVVRVWDVTSCKLLAKTSVATGNCSTFPCYAFSSDGRFALVGQDDGFSLRAPNRPVLDPHNTLTFWDTQRGQKVRALPTDGKAVQQVALSPDGRWALASVTQAKLPGSDDVARRCIYAVRLFDTQTGKLERTVLENSRYPNNALAFARDGRRYAVGSGSTFWLGKQASIWDIKVWDTATGKELANVPARHGDNETPVSCVALAADGERVAYGSGRRVHLWDLSAGRARWDYADEKRPWEPLSLDFSKKGDTILVAAPDLDHERTLPQDGARGLLVLLRTDTGGTVRAFAGTSLWLRSAQFSNDNRLIIAATSKGVVLYRPTDGALLRRLAP